MKLFIKNLVCVRCKKVVENELERIGISDFSIEEGETEIRDHITDDQLEGFKSSIKKLGLEVIDDKTTIIIEKIKNSITELVFHTEEKAKGTLSEYISKKIGYDYNYLSNLFSASCGSSIEKFYIKRKIDRVKELLTYSKNSLSEIAYKAHYSSVAHLSNQFKKETGLTPSHFKKLRESKLTEAPHL
jgi:AraC-like DNA-binding protein